MRDFLRTYVFRRCRDGSLDIVPVTCLATGLMLALFFAIWGDHGMAWGAMGCLFLAWVFREV